MKKGKESVRGVRFTFENEKSLKSQGFYGYNINCNSLCIERRFI